VTGRAGAAIARVRTAPRRYFDAANLTDRAAFDIWQADMVRDIRAHWSKKRVPERRGKRVRDFCAEYGGTPLLFDVFARKRRQDLQGKD
jgi:hypothetical protein